MNQPINILIVDDEPNNLTVLETILDDPSYRLVRAESADQALLTLIGEEFALLILDIQMPTMSGIELAKMIKERKKTAHVPIIFLTAYYNEDQHVLAGYGTGAVDYLHKPVNPAILRSKVAVFADLHRKSRELGLANAALLAEVAERRLAEERLRELNESLDRRVIERSGALLESEHRYRTLFNSMDEGFCVVEIVFDDAGKPIDFRLLEINAAFEKQTGLKNARGSRMRELVPQFEPFWVEVFAEIALTGLSTRFENYSASLGRWYEGFAFRVESRTDPHVGVVFNDITRRKRDAENLRASEKRLRAIYDGTHEYMGLLSPDGTLLESNRASLEFAGSLRDEVVGLPFWETVWFRNTPDLPETIRQAVMRAAAGEVVRFEAAILNPAGETRSFDLAFHPIRGDAGDVVLIVPVGLDVTQRVRAEAALKDADRRKDEFLATLAHELRNPLAPIRTGLQVLKLSPTDSPVVARTREMMERQLGHMVRLIDDLLDVSRISRGKVELRRAPVPLRAVIEHAVEASHPLFEAAGHELTVELAEPAVWLDGDLTRLAQVVSNVLNNAAKYTPNGGRVSLRAGIEADQAVIRVVDNGAGLSAEMLPRVFDLFAQVDRTLDRAQGGLGIGLSLVAKLLEMHGGSIEAQSPGLGLGSTFTIRLPAASAPEGRAVPEPSRPSAGDWPVRRPLRILVVDDSEDGARSLAMLLKMWGHSTCVAHDGLDGIVAASEFLPDLAILDIGLPGMNGYEVCRTLRADPRLARTIFIALTGWGAEEDKARARAAGFAHHLVKPIDPNQIEAVLDKVAEDRARAAM